MVGFIPQIFHQGQLLGVHLRRHLLQDAIAGSLVGQRGDDHIAVLVLPAGPQAHASRAGLIHRQKLVSRRDDLRLRGEIRAGDVFAQVVDRAFRRLQQQDAGPGHFPQIVRGDVRRHAHGDARRPVQQHIGQARGQQLRLFQGAVEIGRPVDGALGQLRQQGLGVRLELGFRVAHGGEGLGIVHGPPVALPVNQWVAVTEILRHQRHGLVTGGVAMGVELADHIPHGAGGFLELGGGAQAQFGHGVNDAPLHGLQAIADVGQGPVQDDIHGVIQVGLFRELLQGPDFRLVLRKIEGERVCHAFRS